MPVSYKWYVNYFVLALDCRWPVLNALFYRAPLSNVREYLTQRIIEVLCKEPWQLDEGHPGTKIEWCCSRHGIGIDILLQETDEGLHICINDKWQDYSFACVQAYQCIEAPLSSVTRSWAEFNRKFKTQAITYGVSWLGTIAGVMCVSAPWPFVVVAGLLLMASLSGYTLVYRLPVFSLT